MNQYFNKAANALLAGYSYLKSSISGKPEVMGMPVSISMELTNICNLHCPECSSGSGRMQREKGYMDIGLFNKVMKELSPYLYNTNIYFQGEPMLHPLFFTFLANTINTHTTVSTNGHFLSEENSERIVKSALNKLIISLDGIDQNTYSAYRINGNVNTVIDGIKNVTVARKKFDSSLKIEIQCLVNKLNESQIPQIRDLANKVNARLRLKSMQITDRKNIGSWLPLNGRLRRYKIKTGNM